jgi:hypothetical protein
MTFEDIAHLNIPLPPRGSDDRGTFRLLRDVLAMGVLQSDRASAGERLESVLGPSLARVVTGSLADGGQPRLKTTRAA